MEADEATTLSTKRQRTTDADEESILSAKRPKLVEANQGSTLAVRRHRELLEAASKRAFFDEERNPLVLADMARMRAESEQVRVREMEEMMKKRTDDPGPLVICSFALSSGCYSKSGGKEPPLMRMTFVSHYPTPITVYLDHCHPQWMREENGFSVTDTRSNERYPQPERRMCRFELPSRFAWKYKLPPDELFYELWPKQPLTVSAPFGPDTLSREQRAQRWEESSRANGVIGLPAGIYEVGLRPSPGHWKAIKWWDYGTKEEVLRPKDKSPPKPADVICGRGPHPRIKLDVSSFKPFLLECVE